jgi:hypothetical protein
MTVKTETELVSESLRVALARVADILIPASERMPSASAAGVASDLLDTTLQIRPDLWRRIEPVLIECERGDAESILRRVEVNDSATFDAITEFVAGTYFMSDQVRELIGYQGQESSTSLMEMTEFVDLIAPVVERGPFYRQAPE